jgi:hypothetical protein
MRTFSRWRVVAVARAFGLIGVALGGLIAVGSNNPANSPQANSGNGQPPPASEMKRLSCGPPDYACSYQGTDAKPLCTDCSWPPVPDMSAKPNAVFYDKVLGIEGAGNQIVRCTYPEMNKLGDGSFGIGFGGSGDSNAIGKAGGSPPTYRLIIGGAPFTYTPDPIHPSCHPTYGSISAFDVAEGSFSWVTSHLYYAFAGNYFKIHAIDLGSSSPPKRTPIADFQQILPRKGIDWPGAHQVVPLGTILKPSHSNSGGYLYQSTCPPAQTSCSSGSTGDATPAFSQAVMTDTSDGTVTWRNIGVGFNDPSTWNTIGGVSTDDDVFVKGMGDAGGQGGRGAIFVAAYKRSTNTYYLYNVGTGIISYFRCTGGVSYDCSGGTWTQTLVGMTALPDRFVLHNVKVNKNGEWVVIVQDACRFRTCMIVPGSFGPYLWQLSTTEAKVNKVTSHPYGHWTEGFRLFANMNGERGVALNGRSFSDPDNQFPLNRFPAESVPAPADAFDAHPSWNYDDGTDTTPICTATAAFDWPYRAPWENEVVCFGTNPDATCSTPGHQLCQTVIKRFFHTYNPATCNQYEGFWSCWAIGALSQDGRYYAFTSNWGDTLGSTSNGGHGPGSCTGGFNFQKGYDYKVGDVFEPGNGTGSGHPNAGFTVFKVTVAGSSNSYPPGAWPRAWSLRQTAGQGFYRNGDTILPPAAHNPCNHQFQVTDGGGAPNGSTPPDWQRSYSYSGSCASVKGGGTIKDGAITWTDVGEFVLGTMHLANLGRDNCRSDVFIGELN